MSHSAKGQGARQAALWLIAEVLDKQRPLDDALEQALRTDGRMARLDGRDKGFARMMAATVLRRLGQIDDAVARCLARPLNNNAETARNVLRLAAAQILFMDTAAHAAVDGAVRQLGRKPHLKGLVNAVARRMVREKDALLATQDAERLNCPDWLWQSWTQAYGETETRKIVACVLGEPAIDITVPHDAPAWAEKLDAEILPTGSLRRKGGGFIEKLPGFAEGAWWIQDAAAALPVRLLGDVAGLTVADLCAAPGGKTAQLAAAGAKVTAVDLSKGRLDRLQANLKRLQLAAETVAADATDWQPDAPFDAVLLDAPCSSTGTIRRHPDIWRLKSPADVTGILPTQDALLDAAARLVKPGGAVVYCTCSLQPEEGPQRIARLLSENSAIERSPIAAGELPGAGEWITPDGDLRTLPHYLGGMDGFYACRLRRTA
jgi:16S rRNA (cytosine967-C5)-methyltransferase